jgi:3-oxoacyl-[acyl-carrier protein] reductase
MDLGLAGKTALITGGSKGIGLACAEALAAEGCHVHLAARNAADLKAAQEDLSARHSVRVMVHEADMSCPETAVQLAKKCGALDILVNNAGAIPRRALLDIDDAQWRAAWDLKVYGSINLSREVYRGMRERRAGAIVNIVGIAGEAPNANSIVGTAGNAALMAFSRALGAESVNHGIRVVAVNPGLVLTDRTRGLLEGGSGSDTAAWGSLMESLPFKRMAHPHEVGDVVAFLASDRASYVSGTVVTIDGGAANRR